mgnify:CR=1 FL=1
MMFGQPKMRRDWPWGFKAEDQVFFGRNRQFGLVTFVPETEDVPNGEVPILHFKDKERREHQVVWVPADDLERASPAPTG